MTSGPRCERGLIFSAFGLLFASRGFTGLWSTSSLPDAKGQGLACVVDSQNISASSPPQSPHISPSPITSHVCPPQSPPPLAPFFLGASSPLPIPNASPSPPIRLLLPFALHGRTSSLPCSSTETMQRRWVEAARCRGSKPCTECGTEVGRGWRRTLLCSSHRQGPLLVQEVYFLSPSCSVVHISCAPSSLPRFIVVIGLLYHF